MKIFLPLLLIPFFSLGQSTYYKYSERDASSQVDYYEINKKFQEGLQNSIEKIKREEKEREETRKRNIADYYEKMRLKKEFDINIQNIKRLTDEINLNPNNIEAYINRGISKYKVGDYIGSISDNSKAIEIDPKIAIAYYNRGLSKYYNNEKESGCIDFSKAGELGLYDAYKFINEFCNRN